MRANSPSCATIGPYYVLREQKYNPGQIDAQWAPIMIDEFNRWAAAKGSKLRMKTPSQ